MKTYRWPLTFGLALIGLISLVAAQPQWFEQAKWLPISAAIGLIVAMVASLTRASGRRVRGYKARRIIHGVVATFTALAAALLSLVIMPLAGERGGSDYGLIVITFGAGAFGTMACGLVLMLVIAAVPPLEPVAAPQ